MRSGAGSFLCAVAQNSQPPEEKGRLDNQEERAGLPTEHGPALPNPTYQSVRDEDALQRGFADTSRIESIKIAFEGNKQLTTLTAAILALTATYVKDVFPRAVNQELIVLSWLLLLVSIFFGIVYGGWFVSALRFANSRADLDVYKRSSRFVALAQVLQLVIGVGL